MMNNYFKGYTYGGNVEFVDNIVLSLSLTSQFKDDYFQPFEHDGYFCDTLANIFKG